MNANLIEGDICKLKSNDYLDLKINKIFPKGHLGRNCVLVECLASGGHYPPNFESCRKMIFRMVDLKI